MVECLGLPVLVAYELVVVAEDAVDVAAGIVVALAGEPTGQMPTFGQVVLDEQAVVGLVAGARSASGHVPSLAIPSVYLR